MIPYYRQSKEELFAALACDETGSDPTEIALLLSAEKVGCYHYGRRLDEIPFDGRDPDCPAHLSPDRRGLGA